MKKIVLEEPALVRSVENYIRQGYSFNMAACESMICMTKGDEFVLLDKNGQDYKKPDIEIRSIYTDVISTMGFWDLYLKDRIKSRNAAVMLIEKLQEKFTEEEWSELVKNVITDSEKEGSYKFC